MRIVCPSCEVAYEVPQPVLERRLLLRCARCAHEFRPDWHDPAPVFADDSGAVDDAVAEAGGDAPAAAAAGVSREERVQVLAAWGASLVVIIIGIWLGIAFRQPVMNAWPPSARVYSALGWRIGHP
jgi:predicted benzoate:H+ symporter BenE